MLSEHAAAVHQDEADPFFEPLQLGSVLLRSRLVMSPMTRGYSPDGVPPPFAGDYYARRAGHGLSLVVTEGIAIDHPSAIGDCGTSGWNIPELHGERALDAWGGVVDRVKATGAAIFPQLWHQGVLRVDYSGRHAGNRSIRPSGIWGGDPSPFFKPEYLARVAPLSEPASDVELADVVEGYARSAANAVALGFDGIAIHGGHGYLPDSFLWAVTNRRNDRWGGPTPAERAAFPAAIVRAVRRVAGDAPIMFRFSQWKLQDYDARIAETPAMLEELLGPLADAGVDLFDASTRKFDAPAFEGDPLTLAGWTRKLTGKATMAVGGVGLAKDLQSSFGGGADIADNLDTARAMIRRGECDLIGVGRSLLSNPDFAERVRAGVPLCPYLPEHHGTRE